MVSKDDTKVSHTFTLMSAAIVISMVLCEVSKQVSIYGTQYLNGGKYPVPQTSMVVMMEIMKLVATMIRSKGELCSLFRQKTIDPTDSDSLAVGEVPSFTGSSLKSSLKFLVPSLLYALNNNIYFLGLTLVAPPLWLILCSMRTAITASVYKVCCIF